MGNNGMDGQPGKPGRAGDKGPIGTPGEFVVICLSPTTVPYYIVFIVC